MDDGRQGTMPLMSATMDAYDREDIFAMFRQRRSSGVRVVSDELRSTPTQVILTARVADSGPVVSVFRFEGRRIAAVADYPSMAAASRRWRRGR